MRRINMYAALLLTTLVFCVHGILSNVGFLIDDFSIQPRFVFVLLRITVVIHVALSLVLSVGTIRAGRKGAWHFRANKNFWIKRITALLILVLSIIHFGGGIYLVHPLLYALYNLLFMFSIMVHAGISAKAVLIKSGAKNVERDYRLIRLSLLVLTLVFVILELLVLFRRLS